MPLEQRLPFNLSCRSLRSATRKRFLTGICIAHVYFGIN
jgi:hypothetical protein